MKSLNLAYNPRIDHLRWLAATLVFLFHFHLEYKRLGGAGLSAPWAALVTEGHTGVGLFFTLSGFLFMLIALDQQTIVYREFLRNRVLRIFPLFLTIFLVATSIGRDKFQPQDILYLFATNLGMAPTSGTVITGAAWTISLELLFYLVFPFLARFAMERGVRYLAQSWHRQRLQQKGKSLFPLRFVLRSDWIRGARSNSSKLGRADSQSFPRRSLSSR